MNRADKINIELKRNDKVLKLKFPLKEIAVDGDINNTDKPRPMLGIRSLNMVEIEIVKIPFWTAVRDSFAETWRITEVTLRGVGQIFSGKRDADEVGGIVRIAEMSGDISRDSGFIDFVIFMALLSINLGLINLFPIPLLDGGHVIIYLIEIVTGRELNENFKDYVFKFGLFLICL
jgi:regulator of sigma E protease